MSFEKYSTKKIEAKSFDLVEGAIELRKIANDMVEQSAGGPEEAFLSSIAAASETLERMGNQIEILKVAFADLTAALSGIEPVEDENGEVEMMVERNPDGSIKF